MKLTNEQKKEAMSLYGDWDSGNLVWVLNASKNALVRAAIRYVLCMR